LESEFDLFGGIDAAGKSAAGGVRAAGDDKRADGTDEFGRRLRWTRAGGEEQGRGCEVGKEGALCRLDHQKGGLCPAVALRGFK
jgi:hypothetical protein